MMTFSTLIFADLDGIGVGKTIGKAKNNALSDLSSKIQVEVRSEFDSIDNDSNKGYVFEDVSHINLKTENDFLGIEFEIKEKTIFDKNYHVKAILKKEKLPLYYKERDKLDRNIVTNFRMSKEASKNQALGYLEDVSSDIKKREGYTYIIIALQGKDKQLPISRYEILKRKQEISRIQNQKTSIVLDVYGDISEKNLIDLKNQLNGSIDSKKFIVKYLEDGSEDYYIVINVLEATTEDIEETIIMPSMTKVKYNIFMEVFDRSGAAIFSQNIIEESEEIEEKDAVKEVIGSIRKKFNKNLVSIRGE